MNAGLKRVANGPLWWGMSLLGGGVTVQAWEQGGDGNSVLYAQFYCETKTALKNEAYSKKKKKSVDLVVVGWNSL